MPRQTTVAGLGNRIRGKETEWLYLVHPLTYRQVYLTKDAYFVEKIHCELVEMAVGQRMNKIRFSCHNIYWFGFLVTIRNFRRAPVVSFWWLKGQGGKMGVKGPKK